MRKVKVLKGKAKAIIGMLLALFFTGYGCVTLFQGETVDGIAQMVFGILIFLGGIIMYKNPLRRR